MQYRISFENRLRPNLDEILDYSSVRQNLLAAPKGVTFGINTFVDQAKRHSSHSTIYIKIYYRDKNRRSMSYKGGFIKQEMHCVCFVSTKERHS